MEFDYSTLTAMILGAGALGNAAFGIVQASKCARVRLAGFGQMKRMLPTPIIQAVEIAFGTNALDLLKAQYVQGRGAGRLGQTLRQGIRIGLSEHNAEELAGVLGGVVEAKRLRKVAKALASSGAVAEEDRGVLARYELAVDARIDASLALAEAAYAQRIRMWAAFVAVVLAIAASFVLMIDPDQPTSSSLDLNILIKGLIVGVAAIPLAPVSHDLVKGFVSVRTAVSGRITQASNK